MEDTTVNPSLNGQPLRNNIRVSIDRGGTFCDVIAQVPGQEDIIFKLLSVDPQNYSDAPTEAIRRVLERVQGRNFIPGEKLDGSAISSCRIGTTIATNALLEHKGERFAFATTKGFKDICVIGDQTRPRLFDLRVEKPKALHQEVIEIDERVTIEDFDLNPQPPCREQLLRDPAVVETASGELVRLLRRPDESEIKSQLETLRGKGYTSLAICLMHSWAFSDHEDMVAKIATDVGFVHVTTSHSTHPAIKLLDRAISVSSEAYLYPIVQAYVAQFENGFHTLPQRLEFMCSDGGLRQARSFRGNDALLSGPAGGVVGVAQSCYDPNRQIPLIGFDMGGTSTDVCRYDGKYDFLSDTKIADRSIVAPMLNIATVAAGGGSILSLLNGLLAVGPSSAGAYPGPACYRNEGPLTVTDANLLLGRLVLSSFPAIFGRNADEPLDLVAVQYKFAELARNFQQETGQTMAPEDLAMGFLDVANEAMSRPIRNATEARGYAPEKHRLVSFGGAGGQHACAIASKLGIETILIPKHSSVLSAHGISEAKLQYEAFAPYSGIWDKEALPALRSMLAELTRKVTGELEAQGADGSSIHYDESVVLRYFGTDTSLTITKPTDEDYGGVFVDEHEREFAFTMQRKIVIEAVKVRGIGSSAAETRDLRRTLEPELVNAKDEQKQTTATTFQPVYLDGSTQQVPVLELGSVACGSMIHGPALLVDSTQTIFVDSKWKAYALTSHVVLEKAFASAGLSGVAELNAVRLSIFAHRFMAIAEQMGNTLQRTSISSSIRERLDYSCAIFDPEGKLVANAPHIPIHLGSMQMAIQAQHQHWKGRLKPGDVLLTNHPDWGGTHLPDLTVVTPCFIDGKISFYLASRGHHTDIGGKGITSMMPESKELWEEGISVPSLKIASGGVFLEDDVRAAFDAAGKFPGCSPTRRIQDNLSDLKAQLSANQRGLVLLQKLCNESGLSLVEHAMIDIQANAGRAVRSFLKDLAARNPEPLTAVDYYDDGTPIKLKITIDANTGSATFDFDGTGSQTWGNFNSPISITHSAVIYTLRCLLDMEIPLNEGCLTPITINVPKYAILNPGPGVAICGSTIASQRVVDTTLKAFGVVAAFQGCASSFGWGTGGRAADGSLTPGWNFGEAIGGGCGAGPGWHGEHATQVHSTNTRMTDPEIVEKRTQVLVRKSVIREGSGGKGQFRGGDGVTREVEARMPLKFSILSDRRVFAPYGMEGGENALPGKNLLFRQRHDDGEHVEVNLGGKAIADLEPGDYIQINTPGGGGWGTPAE